MKRILKGFLSIVLLLVSSAVIYAANGCGPSGCGNGTSTKGAPGCGTCGIVGTNVCSEDSACQESCNDRCCDGFYFGKSHFSQRSQSLDGARRLAGNYGTHLSDKDEVYFVFDATLAYQRTFGGNYGAKIGKYFSPNCTNCFTLGSDSQINIDARNHDFGFNGTAKVCICPRVQNYIADFNLFVGFNEWLDGLFAEVQLPIVYTIWETRCCTNPNKLNLEDENRTFANGLMSLHDDNEVKITDGAAAFAGNTAWGDAPAMCYAKMCCDKQTKVRLADVRFRIGYDFWLKENYHVGAKVIVAAPTGNKPKAVYAFEPIAGNGGHWELGGGLTAHAVIWEKDEDKSISWYFDAEVTHMFKSTQRRTFDLTPNGVWSRYLLLKKFTSDKDSNQVLDEDYPLERGPNVLTQEAKVRINAQADVTSMFRVKYNNWLFDLGYNGWYRSSEKITVCPNIPAKTYGIKGTLDLDNEANQTASKSTIAKAAEVDGGEQPNPEFINSDGSDLNICSATHPFTHSHAAFANVGYIWEDIDWEPVIGFGGKAEFSGRTNTAFDQWAVWAKGSVSF